MQCKSIRSWLGVLVEFLENVGFQKHEYVHLKFLVVLRFQFCATFLKGIGLSKSDTREDQRIYLLFGKQMTRQIVCFMWKQKAAGFL